MKKNMGKTDRIIRILLGLLIGAAGIYFQSWWGLLGLVLLGTALISWCPLYAPFKISTRKSGT
jgi:type IV secretory pathway TrbD component